MADNQSTLPFGAEQSDLKSGIYAIRCEINGKVYIGSAVNISKRWSEHRCDLMKDRHHSPRLQRAWNKYGRKAFVFEVVERVEPALLIAREQFHIDTKQAADRRFGFNIRAKADSFLGCRHSEETKRKMSEIAKNRPAEVIAAFVARNRTPERRAKVSEATKGRNVTPEHRAKVSERCKGRPLTPEHRARLSEAAQSRTPEHCDKIRATLKGRPLSPEHRAKVIAASAGRFQTAEHRAKVSAALTGRPRSEETKRKVSEGLMGHPCSEETRQKLREAWVRRKQRSSNAG
jgi:group I intron endonuclease